jgi:hypothetical protein
MNKSDIQTAVHSYFKLLETAVGEHEIHEWWSDLHRTHTSAFVLKVEAEICASS